MEQDDEIKGDGNSLDFGARICDPRLGRWLSRDPLFYEYPSMSPYVGIGNNPIYFIDPDGRYIKGVTIDENGNIQLDKKATKHTRRVYAAMSKTKTGVEQFKKMIKSPTKIKLFVQEDVLLDRDSNPVHGLTYNRGMKDGNYRIAEIVISTAKIGDRFDNATEEEVLNAVGAHEAEHAASKEQIQKDRTAYGTWETERTPIEIEYTSRTEFNNGDNSEFKDFYENPNPDALDSQKNPKPSFNLIENENKGNE